MCKWTRATCFCFGGAWRAYIDLNCFGRDSAAEWNGRSCRHLLQWEVTIARGNYPQGLNTLTHICKTSYDSVNPQVIPFRIHPCFIFEYQNAWMHSLAKRERRNGERSHVQGVGKITQKHQSPLCLIFACNFPPSLSLSRKYISQIKDSPCVWLEDPVQDCETAFIEFYITDKCGFAFIKVKFQFLCPGTLEANVCDEW